MIEVPLYLLVPMVFITGMISGVVIFIIFLTLVDQW